jgi:membrane protease subunit (stomatin/prohibitin family)
MHEIFSDGIRSIVVANGVVRIELAQLRRSADNDAKMIAEPVATLMMPMVAVNGFLAQLSQTMSQAQSQAQAQAKPPAESPLP